MEINLFFSGAPSDNEWYPKDDKLKYCDRFFSYTESDYSSDFEVEALPQQNCSYYTYLCHKNVSGFDRESSYFGITLKITGGYCADIIGMYDLLAAAFRNCVVDKVIVKKVNGWKYCVRSLSAVEDVRKDAEDKIVKGISLMLNKMLQFDSLFSSSRQQSQSKIFTSGNNNNELIQELKNTHKLHLIPESDMAVVTSIANQKKMDEKIDEYDKKLKTKDGEISAAKESKLKAEKAQKEAEKEIEKLRAELRKDPSERRWQNVYDGLEQIKAQISSIGNKEDDSQNQKTIPTDIKGMLRFLPWVLFALATLGIFFIWMNYPDCEYEKYKQDKQYNELVVKWNKLVKEYEALVEERDQLSSKLNEATKTINGINGVLNEAGQSTLQINSDQPEPSYLDVEGISGGKVKIGSHKIVVKSSGGKKEFPEIDWEITKCDNNCANKKGNMLECNKAGMVVVHAVYNGPKSIDRSIEVVAK